MIHQIPICKKHKISMTSKIVLEDAFWKTIWYCKKCKRGKMDKLIKMVKKGE